LNVSDEKLLMTVFFITDETRFFRRAFRFSIYDEIFFNKTFVLIDGNVFDKRRFVHRMTEFSGYFDIGCPCCGLLLENVATLGPS
jgi:hypothetical protein